MHLTHGQKRLTLNWDAFHFDRKPSAILVRMKKLGI